MKILDARMMKAWDEFTIQHEPVTSIDLMERAAVKCYDWLIRHYPAARFFRIFCGKGNNGGDGLAIARLLIKKEIDVSVHILEFGKPGSEDFQFNLQQLHTLTDKIFFIQSPGHLPGMDPGEIVVDALFGSGLQNPVEGLSEQLILHMNASGAEIISIDIPSGMFYDKSSIGNTVVKASHTLTFQCLKKAFLAAENEEDFGVVHILPIGLHPDFLPASDVSDLLLDINHIRPFFRKRKRFSHKGSYGHVLLAGGSFGKMGAMVLAARACLRTGSGLTTVYVPSAGYNIMQIAAPEAMVITGEEASHLSGLPADIEKYSAIGVGPGMGTEPETVKTVSFFVRRYSKPLVIDADAINCLALDTSLLEQLPAMSILTPHPKEFDRLFGQHENEFKRWDTAGKFSSSLQIIIVLKGHHTCIALPEGKMFFNSTGNSGLAKGGSGDVLTGMIASFLAQGYSPEQSALLGVYLHGLSGDLASARHSEEAMTASDVISFFGKAFDLVRGAEIPEGA